MYHMEGNQADRDKGNIMNIKQASDYLNKNSVKDLIDALEVEYSEYTSKLSEFGEDRVGDNEAEKAAGVLRWFEDYAGDFERGVSVVLADGFFIQLITNKQQIAILKRG